MLDELLQTRRRQAYCGVQTTLKVSNDVNLNNFPINMIVIGASDGE